MIVRNQRCSRVNDEVVRVIAEGSPKLRSFAAAHCFGVSDLGVKLLTDRCRELLHLDFQYCSITDEALQQVSVKCPDLGFLDVSGCEDVTDAGLAALKHCRHLGIVLANGCPQVRHSCTNRSPTHHMPPTVGFSQYLRGFWVGEFPQLQQDCPHEAAAGVVEQRVTQLRGERLAGI